MFVAGAHQIRFGGGVLRLRRTCLQLVIGNVQHGQQLALAHTLAGVHFTAQQVAADTERQRRFLASAHLARIRRHRHATTAIGVNHKHGERRCRRGFGFATSRKQGQQKAAANPSKVVHE
ncbi:hypothetical protein D3C71_1224260 [compost metagenome]